MSSIFALKTDERQLALGNQGLSRMAYDQLAPTRDITTTNFPNGEINFKWDIGGGKWWIPGRSYIRLRCQLSRGNDTSLLRDDETAPALNLMSNMFQSAEFKLNGKTVSRVSDFMAQVSTLKYRQTKSSSWLDTCGKATNFWDDFDVRVNDVSSDGVKAGSIEGEVSTPALNLGISADTTIAYTFATNLITFAFGGASTEDDARQAFPIGSYIQLTDAWGTIPAGGRIQITGHVSATTLTCTNADDTTDVVAIANVMTRVDRGVAQASRRVSNIELIWTPPLSIFDIEGGIPGSASCELTLTPQSSNTYQEAVIESTSASKSAGTLVSEVKFEVTNMYLYTNIINGPRVENTTMSYLLDLEQIRCQASQVNNTNLAQHNFSVSPSTYALTIALQDGRIGSDTRASASRLKSYNVALTENEELKMNRLYVNYAGQNYPSPDAEPSFIESTGLALATLSTDHTVNRYVDSNIYSGSYFSDGGAETLEQFQDRGAYHYFATPRDADDASTRVVVNAGFQSTAITTNMRVLLFDHSRQVCRVEMVDGSIARVDVEDA